MSRTFPLGMPRVCAMMLVFQAVGLGQVSGQGIRVLSPGRVIVSGAPSIPVPPVGTEPGLRALPVNDLTHEEVVAVQRALSEAGVDPGPLDGVLGEAVRRGLREFQSEAGLFVCGCLDRETVRALRLRPRILVAIRDGGGRGVEVISPSRRSWEAEPEAPGVSTPVAAADRESVERWQTQPWWWIGPVRPSSSTVVPAPAGQGRPLGVGATGLGRTAAPAPVRPPSTGFGRYTGRPASPVRPPRGR